MKKSYTVAHQNNARDPFPLSDEQVQREYDFFSQTLAHLAAKAGIEASSEQLANSVILRLKGDVTEAELDDAASRLLIAMNTMEVGNRIGQPTFVVVDERA